MKSRIGSNVLQRLLRQRQLEQQRKAEQQRQEEAQRRNQQQAAARAQAASVQVNRAQANRPQANVRDPNRSSYEPARRNLVELNPDRVPAAIMDRARTTGATASLPSTTVRPPTTVSEARALREERLEQARAAEASRDALAEANQARPNPAVRAELAEATTEVNRLYREAGEAGAFEIDLYARSSRSPAAAEHYAEGVRASSESPSYELGISRGQEQLVEIRQADEVQRAAEAVQTAHDDGGPLAAARELESQAEGLGSPEQVDALLAESGPVLEEIPALSRTGSKPARTTPTSTR